jgi:hypothetical protein
MDSDHLVDLHEQAVVHGAQSLISVFYTGAAISLR